MSMLVFEDDFFREEERDGFIVSEMMKHAWAAELEVLAQVSAICERHGLIYYADYGTMLGAVRHGGFVPWDDDIDIALKRPDYMRLLGILQKELPEYFHISSIYTDIHHRHPGAAVMNGHRVVWDEERMQRFHGCPFVCGIDIYPLDGVPRDPEVLQMQQLLYSAVFDAAQRYEQLQQTGELDQYLVQIEELCQVKFTEQDPLCGQLCKLADRIAMMFPETECGQLTQMTRLVTMDAKFLLEKEWYADVIQMPFENISVNVPVGYREILAVMYGDWQHPVRATASHDYPFYKKQMEALGMQ